MILRKLLPLKSEVVISPLPNWILKTFSKPRDLTPEQIDIGAIEPYLYDNLMPFQKEGIKFGVSRQGRVLIADDMGLGKTVQAQTGVLISSVTPEAELPVMSWFEK